MARTLSEKDWGILKGLAPECSDTICSGSGAAYRSILPPLANHYASDANDFEDRLGRLDTEDLRYLVDLVQDGSESLSCVPPAYAEIFLGIVAKRLSRVLAERILEIYEQSGECS
ncbi:MAG: hypothetical protein QMD46_05705 [Methanomicrobiales archaeon]|nr:hypothetical protein [Methanomicrobiales archaeon]MDI6875636.1 hypothetical protein [Methanomicrobiales archaeon]